MGCVFLTLVDLGPRAGILVLAWTTLMDVVRPRGVAGFDWIWLGLAVLADLAMDTGGAYKREQVPGDAGYASRDSSYRRPRCT